MSGRDRMNTIPPSSDVIVTRSRRAGGRSIRTDPIAADPSTNAAAGTANDAVGFSP